ncbi:hypothetical protein P8452_62698 [Trifolium repens]|nr:mediator of RNA polymerase II transcription subunit [Trifolium repens]WJX79589.1 hypothetical protein P8452_62698 [Trifolium repens]
MELEEHGVLSESARSRKDLWGMHMPLVCPDGAVVAYVWKRQLAGQAGASAVDRSRLALKAFTDQKRRFFPHLDGGIETNESATKKQCGSEEVAFEPKEFERLDWLKSASTLTSLNESLDEHNYRGSNKRRLGSMGMVAPEKVAVVELLFPSIFRAVISLHPAGSTDPDAVAFFSPDESGSYVHARGFSAHHVYRHITDYAMIALQYFLGSQAGTSLYSLLHWICRYQTLFSRSCRKCSKLLSMDKQSNLLLPPVHRPYRKFSFSNILSTISSKDQNSDSTMAYHIGCLSEEV